MTAGVKTLLESRFLERLRRKDVALWAKHLQDNRLIHNSLGWISAPAAAAVSLGPWRSFAQEIKTEGWQSVAVLGMGGSILSCRVFQDCFPKAAGFARLEILDSIHPDAVRNFEALLDLRKTLFIVSSKSGSTVETICLMDYFYAKLDKLFPGKAGQRFIAITDPGTSLEHTARRLVFRRIFTTPPDIGGRFSAWTAFGLVPAALTGIDIEHLVRSALAAENELWPPSQQNPALELGARLAQAQNDGISILTLVLPQNLRSLGPWISQMIAEALGKNGRGLLPVIQEEQAAQTAQTPGINELCVRVDKIADVAFEFLRWEIAACAAAFLTDLNPFGEPDVEAAKTATRDILETLERKNAAKTAAGTQRPDFQASGITAFCDPSLKDLLSLNDSGDYRSLAETLAAHLGRGRRGDYCAILAYASPDEGRAGPLRALATLIKERFGVETILDFGPAYLHSCGQFYKGGRDSGLFIEIIQPEEKRLPLPRRHYGFENVCRAQAEGDFTAMLQARRRILRLDLGDAGANHLAALVNALKPKKSSTEKNIPCRN